MFNFNSSKRFDADFWETGLCQLIYLLIIFYGPFWMKSAYGMYLVNNAMVWFNPRCELLGC